LFIFILIDTFEAKLKTNTMIQRVQTLYLLAVTIITILMFFFPFINTIQADGLIYALKFNGFAAVDGSLIAPVYPLAGIIAVCALVSFISIFMFKKRMWQIRMNTFNIILFFFIYVVALGYFFLLKDDLNIQDYSLGISFLFPAVNSILTYLAIRAIGADEAMVKSLNRLR
jgi:hypothetical protein